MQFNYAGMDNSSTGTQMNITSNSLEGDSFYGYTDGFHTIAVQYQNFQGRVFIEATLSLEPTESDWFPVGITGGVSITQGGYKQFPSSGTDGVTVTEAYTFRGNFTYIRFRVDRSYLGDGATYDSSYGTIASVRMSA